MAAAAMKHMASNFAKLDKFEGVDFRRWQKKMHFLLSSMSVVYMLTIPMPNDGGDNPTVEQNVESSKELWDSLEAKYMAEDASSKKFLVSNFTNTKMTDSEQYNELLGILGRFTQPKMNMDEAIKDSDKPKGNNVAGPQLNIVNDNIGSTFMSTSKLNDSILWHARLGHIHFKRMQDMLKDGLILAFDMDTEKTESRVLGLVVRLPDPKLKALDERGIECIFDGDAIFDENRFSSVPLPSQRSLVNGTKDIGCSMVHGKVTEEVVQQPEPELRKSKKNKTPKDFGPEFQLYLIEGTRIFFG
ncbi:zinc finger, CCHC-type containing protein [Tanacetum coccineum]|uniref:Zinc finger, CCHC-type containing protein n=1 Tax=Tanacetum coccineum TaxID=301880 RepID=A0ABQ5BWF5_9ASTR